MVECNTKRGLTQHIGLDRWYPNPSTVMGPGRRLQWHLRRGAVVIVGVIALAGAGVVGSCVHRQNIDIQVLRQASRCGGEGVYIC